LTKFAGFQKSNDLERIINVFKLKLYAMTKNITLYIEGWETGAQEGRSHLTPAQNEDDMTCSGNNPKGRSRQTSQP
jgi:hypothetical protein